MIALAVTAAIIIIIALLRFGVSVEYSAEGFSVAARVGPFHSRVFPRKVKQKKAEKKEARKRAKKEKKDKRKKEKPKEKKPGALKDYLNMLPAIRNTLGRLRRRLLIKKLTVHVIFADEDPSKTAIAFGAANAAYGTVVPLLESFFRIKRRDLRTSADFEATEPSIYVKAVISLAVWEALYIAFAILPILLRNTKKIAGKVGEENGKTPDKRTNGDNNAKGQGHDRRQHDRG